jgi:hypothetical protein
MASTHPLERQAGRRRPPPHRENDRVKWTRAVKHLEALAQTCAEMATGPHAIFSLRVVQLWAIGDILGAVRDVETVTVALAVVLPVHDVPWMSEPPGSQHWASATHLTKNPIIALWRSAYAPVWNHHIDRPALLWDSASGVAEETLAALKQGRGDRVRLPAPTPEDLRARLDEELIVSLRALRGQTRAYDDRRWRPGKLEPVADALWRASDGYLDVLDAVRRA